MARAAKTAMPPATTSAITNLKMAKLGPRWPLAVLPGPKKPAKQAGFLLGGQDGHDGHVAVSPRMLKRVGPSLFPFLPEATDEKARHLFPLLGTYSLADHRPGSDKRERPVGGGPMEPYGEKIQTGCLQPATRTETTVGLDDLQVIDAVDEYLSALQAGRQPNRGALLARFPAIRDALAGCLDAVEFVQRAATD
jgi:hypothetical protein